MARNRATDEQANQYLVIGIAVGAGLGATIGVLIGGWAIAIGISLGAGAGMAIGAAIDEHQSSPAKWASRRSWSAGCLGLTPIAGLELNAFPQVTMSE